MGCAFVAIVGRDGFALDFRREAPDPVPAGSEVLHHLGLYAWRRERLLAFTALAPSPRERAERLPQGEYGVVIVGAAHLATDRESAYKRCADAGFVCRSHELRP